MEEPYVFNVTGLPAPGGSKRAFVVRTKAGPRAVVTDDCKRNKTWRTDVIEQVQTQWGASQAWTGNGPELLTGPLTVMLVFFLPRPKGHRRKDGALRPAAPAYPATKPDVLKLARSTEDALTGILWRDDAQIVFETLEKRYADDRPPGCHIRVRTL